MSFDSTYEGLKPGSGVPQPDMGDRFDSTYEGLKPLADQRRQRVQRRFRQYL